MKTLPDDMLLASSNFNVADLRAIFNYFIEAEIRLQVGSVSYIQSHEEFAQFQDVSQQCTAAALIDNLIFLLKMLMLTS